MYTEKDYNDSLYHHGIKGMKWGVRRFQNPDGSYTGEGRRRYGILGNGKKSKRFDSRTERKIRIEREKRDGAREDAISYKYNKPNESGWKGMARAVGAKMKPKISAKINAQLAESKHYSKHHSTAGIVVRQAGKTFVQGAIVGFAATPLVLLSGPASPLVIAGTSAAGAIIAGNNAAKAVTSIGYKYGLDKKLKG